jgi:argininosuccinate synthase
MYAKEPQFKIQVANKEHIQYAKIISQMIDESAKTQSIGLARRTPQYIKDKMIEGKAIIALTHENKPAGFCYIETWTHGKYVANSGLIVAPQYRNLHLGKKIKQAAFKLSREKYPKAKIFSITTSHAVMKLNAELGYKPVPFSELTTDTEFWDGCSTCVNYDILERNKRKNCLCTALIFDPLIKPRKRMEGDKNRKVVLAFSGGLDTSYCVKYLSLVEDLEVYSVVVNTGGFSTQELAAIEKRAYDLGVKEHVVLDETNNYYHNCIKYLIFGNVLKNNTYPLSVSSERVFQAIAVAKYAKKINADNIAHGSTGAGNDQVRFDIIFQILAPKLRILTPIRDNKLSRNESIEFLKQHGIQQDWSEAQYSINKGLWGTSVGGRETLTSCDFLPEEAFPTPLSKKNPQSIELEFRQGELVGVDNKEFSHPVEAIKKLNEIAAPFAIGRDMHVGDTIIGIKGRVGFEAAAPLMIIKAHHALEKHLLTKWQLYWKEQLGNWYGHLLHEGQFLDPIMRNIESFLDATQENVSGTVSVYLAPYRFQILGITSPYDMMSPEIAQYGEMNIAWTGEDIKGFSKTLANQAMIYYKVNRDYRKKLGLSEDE